MFNNEALNAKLSKPKFSFLSSKGRGGYLVAKINDLMGLITPLYLLAPEEKVNSHSPYLGFEWVEEINLNLESGILSGGKLQRIAIVF